MEESKTSENCRSVCLAISYKQEKSPQILFPLSRPSTRMLVPDHQTSKLGSKDFVFQVNKWPFSITCNPLLPSITESYIDLALVKDMKIPIKKVECRSISYGGLQTKLVGSISQTVQVVYDGVPSGTMHLKAKVIRHLSNLYGIDCIAGKKLYNTLASSQRTSEAADNSVANSDVTNAVPSEEESFDDSFNELIFNVDDSPKTWKRKRRNRCMAANMSFSSSLASTPLSSSRTSSPDPMKENFPQVQPTSPNLMSLSSGNPPPERPRLQDQDGQDPSPPPPSAHVMLHELVLCGNYQPCPCLPLLRGQQCGLLPPHYPVYLPVGHQPCSQDCGAHHVHGDNLHPPNPSLCPCSPPRLQPSGYVGHVPIEDEPPLPQGFQPCGYYCAYDSCECLRQYDGRDFAS